MIMVIIPSKVKIGGLSYTVNITDWLKIGEDFGAEIRFKDLEINVRKMACERMQRSFLHEIFHAVFDNLGYEEHDEKKIDEISGAFYALIVDNPEMFNSDLIVTKNPENTVVSRPQSNITQ